MTEVSVSAVLAFLAAVLAAVEPLLPMEAVLSKALRKWR
jgi:hypothetical protein